MASTTGREAFEDLRAAQDEVPPVAGGRGWRVGVRRGGGTAWRPAIDISERGHGVFRRSVTLPSSHVNADRTEASARDGVLEILVPKAPRAQAGLIRIGVSQENAVLTPGHNDEER